MTSYPDDDSHQLKISKLQERLGSISGQLRKSLAEPSKERQAHFESTYSRPAATDIHEKQVRFEPAKEPSRDEMQQQARQEENYRALEAQRIAVEQQTKQSDDLKWLETVREFENQERSKGVILSKKLEGQEPARVEDKQKAMQESKSWQPWKSIPKEKLSQLEKKTLSRLFKKR